MSLPCIICDKALRDVLPIEAGENHPFSGTEFYTSGHYGSTVIDGGGTIVLNLCDPCLRLMIAQGKAVRKRDGDIRVWLRAK